MTKERREYGERLLADIAEAESLADRVNARGRFRDRGPALLREALDEISRLRGLLWANEVDGDWRG